MNIAHTGKSQASAIDIHSRIESQFLERYSRYIVQDDCYTFLTDSYMQMIYALDQKRVSPSQLIQYKTHQINNQNTDVHVFFALKSFAFSHFSTIYNKILDQFNLYSKDDSKSIRSVANQEDYQAQRKQLLMRYERSSYNDLDLSQKQVNFHELYSNKYASENNTVQQGEIVILDSKIKCNSHRTKSLIYDVKKKIDNLFRSTKVQHQIIESEYLPYVREYKLSSITVILFYNGDVNYDFSKTMNLNTITINNTLYNVKLKIFFVSKLSLFMHFKESNGQQKIECITDRIITFYDMNRTRQQKAKILKDIDLIKKDVSDNHDNQKKRKFYKSFLTVTLVSLVVIIGGYFLFGKKVDGVKNFLSFMQ